jgi:ribosome-dependent ATPase
MSGAAPPVARLCGVAHRFGVVAALDGITLDVPAGAMAGVVGPDGVGKSTLLALIAGVRRPQEGRVEVLGGDMGSPAHLDRCRHRIAYVPQGLGRNLYPTLSVAENVDFFGRLFGLGAGQRRARAEMLLAATGLAAFAARPAGKLSGGMKQKLSLCCALIHEPDLLVLDEPTTGVDPLSRRQFWSLIAELRAVRRAMSVLVATAYMEEAERFDWLAALDSGRAIAVGTPAAVKAEAKATTLEDAFIALLPADRRSLHAPLPPTQRQAPDMSSPPAIEARGLTKRFGSFVAVDGVDLTIARGEIFGFLGSNGCGKSTTMRMLTGLLPADAGMARVLGRTPGEGGADARRDVGYMSQSFSLYEELTVRQNLDLHAHLYGVAAGRRAGRVSELLREFQLDAVADARPESLPLGMRQRLQLAAAMVHEPSLLILDEPTSGVDPLARDLFWRHLLALSRERGVTVFISTHFMNEAARCDRISLMHAGRVLAVGRPEDLVSARGAADLEEAFVALLRDAAGREAEPAPHPLASGAGCGAAAPQQRFEIRRLLACAWREGSELLRDRVRIAFALLSPLILMIAFGFGISFDVERLGFAVLDGDRSPESRLLVEGFQGSRYFAERPPILDAEDRERRLESGELALAIEVPPGFGRDLRRGARPEVGITLDGTMPFRAETVRAYVGGIALAWLRDRLAEGAAPPSPPPVVLETRLRYNQAFLSAFAIVPGIIMMMLVLVPAMMAAVGVVREKETGAIANFRATPVTAFEFLAGKQLPYVAVGLASFVMLLALAAVAFGVTVRGSFVALAAGALLYVLATTGFGLLVSTFVQTQVAAIFATAVLSMIFAVNFSGLLVPVSSLSGPASIAGQLFPAGWFQMIAVGTISKGLGFAELWRAHVALAGFALVLVGGATLMLRKQER